MIAVVRDEERAVGGQRLPGLELDGLRAFDGDARALGGLANRQIEQAGDGFHVAHGEARRRGARCWPWECRRRSRTQPCAACCAGRSPPSAAAPSRGDPRGWRPRSSRNRRAHPPVHAPRCASRSRPAAPGHCSGSGPVARARPGNCSKKADLDALLDAIRGLARDDMPAGGAVARILEVFVRMPTRRRTRRCTRSSSSSASLA